MFYTEAGRLIPHWFLLVPLAQQNVTVTLSGVALLVFFIFLGAYIGYQRGVRALITVLLFTTLGYLWSVRGGDIVFGAVNRLIQIIPRFAGIVFDRGDWATTTWPAVIPTGIASLAWRVVFFIAMVIIGLLFNQSPGWYGKAPAQLETWARPLGAFGGGLIAMLWTTAAGIFYRIAEGEGTFIRGVLGDMLRAIPDPGLLGTLLPLAIFFLILMGVVLLRLPYVFAVPVPPQKK